MVPVRVSRSRPIASAQARRSLVAPAVRVWPSRPGTIGEAAFEITSRVAMVLVP